MKRSICLVIGANGFVGSHLVDELVEAGFDVRAFDRFSHEPQYKPSSQIEKWQGDMMNMASIEKALQGVDYLFHSFSATTPFSAEDDPFTDISQNLLQNVRLFEQAVTAKVKKVIYISSGGAVYGRVAEGFRSYEHDAPRPISPYGISKLATEHYLDYFKRKFDLDYVVYRLTNPYGPRQILKHNQGVIPSFLDKLASNESVTVFGDGKASRDYIYIRDATRMIATSFYVNSKHHIYNIGSGRQTSINKLLNTIQSLMKRKTTVEYIEAPKTFLKRSRVSIKRYVEEFGQPELTPLKEGLRHTIAAHEQNT